MWTLLMLAVCSSLQLIALGDARRQPLRSGPNVPACKNNEEYQQCGCLKTCCNGGKPEGCAAQCTSGCFCKDGLVKNKNGDCIPLKDCNKTSGPPPPVCGPDEEHYNCVPTCRDTCDNYNSKNAICPEYCRSGCFCKKGWVKNSDGKCVPTSQCKPPTVKPPICPVDEQYYPDCAPSCTGTCETYNTNGTYHCPLCRPGCWCKKGLVRDQDGKCIPPSKCVVTDKCGYNEQRVACAKPKWCNTCAIKGNCKLTHCEVGCDCKPNYYRNESGICIPESQCPGSSPSCGEDEVYYKNCAPSCTGSCDTYGKEAVILCPICRPGCWCKQGLVKNKDGKCIPFSQCEKPNGECGPDEEYQECGTLCPRTCANLPYQIRCIAGCKTGCFCKEGFVRNDDDVCVKPEQCENNQCKANEEYRNCGTACPATCSNLGNPQPCSDVCVSGCFCQEGFVKDDNGACVEPSECPTEKCGKNEMYTTCGSACPETCENKDKNIFCTLQCVPGCFCIKGYVRNAKDQCINASECEPTKQCGVNEIYTTCGSACPATCSNSNNKRVCIQVCVKGCFCKKGYIKNDDGRCVRPNECHTNQCGVDEVYQECGTACPRTCASLYTKIRCIEKCVPGCFCRDDLVRDNGKCIDIRDCQTQRCGPNEDYKKCGTACPVTCANRDDKNQVCTDQCVAGCFCKAGYVKNDYGECVEPYRCPPRRCRGENEQYYGCGPCVRTCENKDEEISCTQDCRPGCFCKEGYVRNKSNKCVLPDQCPPVCSGLNEVYVDCAKPKSCNTCELRGLCSLTRCVKGCDCKPDFYRNQSGTCIPAERCPVPSSGFDCDKGADTGPCKAHMPRYYYDKDSGRCKSFIYGGCKGNKNNFVTREECNKRCGGFDGRPDCDLAPEAGPCFGSIPRFYYDSDSDECKSFIYGGCMGNSNNFVTEDECYENCGSTSNPYECDKGPEIGPCRARISRYYYDQKDGKCKTFIYGGCEGNKNNFKTKDECNTKCGRQCGANEEYQTCGTACPERCSNRGKPINCTRQCIEGCFCKKGFVRNDTGKCVRPQSCHTDTCGVNEEYQKCGTACPATCRNLNTKLSCSYSCVEGCFCKPGLVRNDDRECVDPSDCPNEECGVNEIYTTCGSACPLTCANKDTEGTCTLQCVIGCFCKNGYVRDSEGKCIPEDQCPTDKCDGYNEALVDCAKPKWCNTCLIKGNCKLSKCEKGCDCKPNYYRNETEICIPESQCPGFCQVNEEYSNCVNPCNTCEIRGKCNFLVCNKGCDCKKGYYRDNISGICIPAETCPITSQCGVDEVYKECGTACPKTCKNLNVQIYCIAVCKTGCFCRDGLVRNDHGKCVEPSKCPKGQCGVDEVYKECGTACPRTCKNLDAKFKCAAVCKKGCFCRDGLVKNDDGKCVNPSDCPKVLPSGERCGPLEQYYSCIPFCHNTCENYNKTNIACSDVCGPGCFCREGLVLRKDKKCVRPFQCNLTPEICGENEQYYGCGPCEKTCENKDEVIFCTQDCRPGCFCKKGYVRIGKNKCVLPDQCPSEDCDGYNEEFVDCAKPKWCNTCVIKGNCKLATCEEGCDCKPNYYRNVTGVCIPEGQCPGFCQVNEEYSTCVNPCNTCSIRGLCNFLVCNKGCDCKKGYYRDDTSGICIPAETCPITSTPIPECDVDEQYYNCTPDCENTCENYNNPNVVCLKICRRGCFCKAGLVKRSDGECVRPSDCDNTPVLPSERCGAHEQYYECVPNCHNTCETYGKTNIVCSRLCRQGCFCREGLVLRKDGKCVRPAECNLPPERCGENEQYYRCGPCEKTCENKDEEIFCTYECRTGCFCKKRYVRNSENKCVLPDQCPSEPPTCGRHERYYSCPPICNTCETYKNGTGNFCSHLCRPGCFCKEGYVLRKDGKCVRPAKCDLSTGPGKRCGRDEEYYEDCAPSCGGTCGREVVIDCPPCRPGCWCKQGLIKSKDGKRCITPEECNPPTDECGEDEVYDECGTACPKTCKNLNIKINCLDVCIKGCFCRDGLVRNDDGNCVEPSECPKEPTPSCPKDQQHYPCIPTCNRTCMTHNSTDAYCTKECIKGCFCKEGLVMNKDGECVKPEDCPPSCDFTQQHYECMPDCQNLCNPPEFCDTLCRSGCFCRSDLVLREDNMCVRKELCDDTSPPPIRCGPQKEYYTCYSTCENRCESYGNEQTVCPALCEIGCFCKRGLLVDRFGRCVTPEECEAIDETSEGTELLEGGERERRWTGVEERRWSSGGGDEGWWSGGEERVWTDDEESEWTGDEEHKVRTSRETRRLRSRRPHNLGGNLFPVYGSKRCGLNEEVINCAKPKSCNTCELRGNCNLTNCTRGCDCIPGYYRDELRICIPESDCPQYENPDDCGLNEEYDECGPVCPLTCDNYDQLIMCTLNCQPGCFCRENYVRNAEGACILPSECPQGRRRKPTRGRGGPISPRRGFRPYRREPSEWVGQGSDSDESDVEVFGGNGRDRGYSRNSQWTVYEDDDNANEEGFSETRVSSGSRTGALTEEGYFTDYSESTEDDSENEDEYVEWEEEIEWVY